jgi:hypothetical protein
MADGLRREPMTVFAGTLDNAGANEQMLAAELRVAHTLGVAK